MVTVFAGGYADVFAAMQDFQAMKEQHAERRLGDYEAALVTREPGGKIIISNVDSSRRARGGAVGALAGGVLGVAFPPSVIGMAALAAAAGAGAENVRKHLKRGDFKQLGELLEEGSSGIVIVADSVTDAAVDELLPQARRRMHTQAEADPAAIKAAVEDGVLLDRGPRV
jgi:uncharacterized membrane protein